MILWPLRKSQFHFLVSGTEKKKGKRKRKEKGSGVIGKEKGEKKKGKRKRGKEKGEKKKGKRKKRKRVGSHCFAAPSVPSARRTGAQAWRTSVRQPAPSRLEASATAPDQVCHGRHGWPQATPYLPPARHHATKSSTQFPRPQIPRHPTTPKPPATPQ